MNDQCDCRNTSHPSKDEFDTRMNMKEKELLDCFKAKEIKHRKESF